MNLGTWFMAVVCFLGVCLIVVLIEKAIDAHYPFGDEQDGH